MLRAEGPAPAAPVERTSAVPRLAAARSLSGYSWSVIGATALGFILRVFLLGTPPLWRDEAFSAVVVRRSWLDMFAVIRHDSAPPLSYILLKLANTVSSSPVSLRTSAVLAGTAMVPVAAALGRRAGAARAGVLAAAAMAVMPAYVAQARDIRMYALGGFFLLASLLTLWRAVDRPSVGRLAVHALCVALALFTSYLAVFGIVAETAAVLLVLRPPLRVLLRVALATAVAGVALVPWLLYALPQFQHAGVPFWVQPVGIGRVEDLWQEFVAGDTLRPQYPNAFAINLLRLLACAGAAIGGAGWIATVWQTRGAERRRALYPATAALLAIAVLIAVSLYRPLFDSRYAAMIELPAVVAVGAGLAWLWPRRRPLGAAAVALGLALMTAHAVALGPNPPNDDIRPLVAPLAGQVGGDDYVAVKGALQYFTVMYYADAPTQARIHVIEDRVSWYDGTAAYSADTWQQRVPPVPGRVYVIAQEGTGLDMPAGFSLRDQQCAAQYCLQTWTR
jgi:4-amino-4-deoxy-L-arabinose transferase-like glycosyltransferase